MAGSIILSVVSVEKAGGIGALVDAVRAIGRGERQGLPVGLPAARPGPAAGLLRGAFRPVVGGLLSRRRAGRRRLERPEDPGGQGPAARGQGDAVVHRRQLRGPALALDPDGPRGDRRLPGTDGGGAGRDGGGLPADDRLRAEGDRGHHHRLALRRLHVDDRVDRQPVGVVPAQRFLPAVREEGREREALRHGLADHGPRHRAPRGRLLLCPGQRQDGLAAGHGALGRDRAGAAAALVLVAHQRLVGDRGPERVGGDGDLSQGRAGQRARARAGAGAREGGIRRRSVGRRASC